MRDRHDPKPQELKFQLLGLTSCDASGGLLHILQDMMRNEAVYQKIRKQQLKEKGLPAVLEVPLGELESRGGAYNL